MGNSNVAKAPPIARDLRTDLANAERFVSLCADQFDWSIRYVPHWKTWLIWDGSRWERDQLSQIYLVAKDLAGSIYAEAANAPDEKARSALAAWARQSEDLRRIKAALVLAQKEPGIAILPEELDSDPRLFNVANGTIDLERGKLRSARRDDLITKIATVEYSPDARCPRWDQFLLEIMAGDEQLTAFLRRLVGYCLTGLTSERVIFVLHGVGSNGKSVLLAALTHIFGDFAIPCDPSTLMVKRGDSIRNDVARLAGARFVPTSESEQGRHLAESLIKQMAGGTDKISARFLYGEVFSFLPTHKILLATNSKPVIRGRDPAIWSRILLIPFNQCFHRADEAGVPKQDPGLIDTLKAEAPGILRWAVEGCLEWQRDGLCPPDAVRAATRQYRSEMDNVERFFEDGVTFLPEAKVTSGALTKAYRDWSERSGEEPVSGNELAAELRSRGCESEKVNRARGWKGVGLIGGES